MPLAVFALLYAHEDDRGVERLKSVIAPNRIKKALNAHNPMKRLIYLGNARTARSLFDRSNLPDGERGTRTS